MEVLITGVAGFIGFHLAVDFLKNGHSVIGIDNLNSYYDVSLKKIEIGSIISNFSKDENRI